MAPCNKSFEDGEVFGTAWGPSGRPKSYLPPTMAGTVKRILPLSFYSGDPSVPLGATTVVDDSIDWRKRIFKTIWASDTATANAFDWVADGGDFPVGGNVCEALISSSFRTNIDSIIAQPSGLAAGSNVYLEVNKDTGVLQVQVGATNPEHAIIFWIEASGQFENAF
jgi:hypothetical protein